MTAESCATRLPPVVKATAEESSRTGLPGAPIDCPCDTFRVMPLGAVVVPLIP